MSWLRSRRLLRGLKIMKIKDVIERLKEEGTWVRWNRCTRDRVLYGNEDQEVKKIGVCWVATNKMIEQAKLVQKSRTNI